MSKQLEIPLRNNLRNDTEQQIVHCEGLNKTLHVLASSYLPEPIQQRSSFLFNTSLHFELSESLDIVILGWADYTQQEEEINRKLNEIRQEIYTYELDTCVHIYGVTNNDQLGSSLE